MTVRVERSFELAAPPDRVWAFIADPAKRARAISVVEGYTLDEANGRRTTWHVELPIPFVDRTIPVETWDVTRDPPRFVEFTGRSKVMDVTGEHEIEATAAGSRLTNRFTVDGRVPGVERFFKHNLDDELENLRRAAERDIEHESASGDR